MFCRENEANQIDQLKLNVESEIRKRQQVEEHLSSVKAVSGIKINIPDEN